MNWFDKLTAWQKALVIGAIAFVVICVAYAPVAIAESVLARQKRRSAMRRIGYPESWTGELPSPESLRRRRRVYG